LVQLNQSYNVSQKILEELKHDHNALKSDVQSIFFKPEDVIRELRFGFLKDSYEAITSGNDRKWRPVNHQ